MTKKELSQLFYLNKEIKMQKEQIAEIERLLAKAQKAKADSVQGSSPTFPFCKKSILLAGLDGAGIEACFKYRDKIEELKRLLEANQQKLVAEYDRINRYIQSVEDSMIRQILTLRYVDGFCWQHIAVTIGGNNTADGIRIKHDRFIARI